MCTPQPLQKEHADLPNFQGGLHVAVLPYLHQSTLKHIQAACFTFLFLSCKCSSRSRLPRGPCSCRLTSQHGRRACPLQACLCHLFCACPLAPEHETELIDIASASILAAQDFRPPDLSHSQARPVTACGLLATDPVDELGQFWATVDTTKTGQIDVNSLPPPPPHMIPILSLDLKKGPGG